MAYESNSIFWVEVEKVVPNPFQPRREFDQNKLNELSESIRMYGVLQPLVVTRREVPMENGAFRSEYELIAGERRLRASKLAGLEQVPVIIRSGEETELMKLELAIIENLQREDLNPVDRALAFHQLADKFGLSHGQVGKKVGRSREYVSNSIRLLQLPETILNALRNGDIADGHARTLLMLNDRPEEQDVVFRETLLKKLSVREVERITRKIATDKIRKKDWQGSDPELIAIERKFTESLGTRVQISKTDYGGRLMIDYFSEEDLNQLLDMVNTSDAQMPSHNATIAHLAAATPVEGIKEGDMTQESSEPVITQAPEKVEPVIQEAWTKPAAEEPSEVQPRVEPVQPAEHVATPELPISAPTNHEDMPRDITPPPAPQTVEAPSPVAEPPAPVIENDGFRVPGVTPTDQPPAPATETREDDSLYSLKNFSL